MEQNLANGVRRKADAGTGMFGNKRDGNVRSHHIAFAWSFHGFGLISRMPHPSPKPHAAAGLLGTLGRADAPDGARQTGMV